MTGEERKYCKRAIGLHSIKIIMMLICCGIYTTTSYAQDSAIHEEKESIFRFVDHQATFPGGATALYNYLGSHIVTPKCDDSKYLTGTVQVEFVVDEEGGISKIKILKGLRPDYDRACVKVVRNMPRWEPAQNQGKPVKSYYIIPISFKPN